MISICYCVDIPFFGLSTDHPGVLALGYVKKMTPWSAVTKELTSTSWSLLSLNTTSHESRQKEKR